jgi:hypothetical protein
MSPVASTVAQTRVMSGTPPGTPVVLQSMRRSSGMMSARTPVATVTESETPNSQERIPTIFPIVAFRGAAIKVRSGIVDVARRLRESGAISSSL